MAWLVGQSPGQWPRLRSVVAMPLTKPCMAAIVKVPVIGEAFLVKGIPVAAVAEAVEVGVLLVPLPVMVGVPLVRFMLLAAAGELEVPLVMFSPRAPYLRLPK